MLGVRWTKAAGLVRDGGLADDGRLVIRVVELSRFAGLTYRNRFVPMTRVSAKLHWFAS
jgi:hypothetical protein